MESQSPPKVDHPAPSHPKAAAPLRFVTTTSLFDGHDAAINVMRRLIQSHGVEVVHLGHNRSVDDVVRAALQEDADAIAISSYQGGHIEYFTYMVDMLRERGAGHIRVFGGGGGTITLDEAALLEDRGVERLYHPTDGKHLGLLGMIEDVIARTRAARDKRERDGLERPLSLPALHDEAGIARILSLIEQGHYDATSLSGLTGMPGKGHLTPVVGITGTGGAGKSSVVDELLLRFLQSFPKMRIAVIAVDPSRRRSGGALLGDRIRMNALRSPRVFMRSTATRRRNLATSAPLRHYIRFLQSVGYDLVIVETAGIGQSDSEIVDLVDFPVYVMTSDFGAESQLEKIDMLDFAELVVLNKYDQGGAEDALRAVRKQWRRNRSVFDLSDDEVPAYPTIASHFNDPGLTWMFVNLCRLLRDKLSLPSDQWSPEVDTTSRLPQPTTLIPSRRLRYLAEIAESGRLVDATIEREIEAASLVQAFWKALQKLPDPSLPPALERYSAEALAGDAEPTLAALRRQYQTALETLSPEAVDLLREWPTRLKSITLPTYEYEVRGNRVIGENYVESLSRQQIPKIAAPHYTGWGDQVRFLMRENLPGEYPYTAGVYPYRRATETPTRMFAGEGTPERTNRRFHYLSRGQQVARLSTAFDSVTLYGEDPHVRPDIYGKVGNSGVSIATLDDMKKLYSGFNLAAPTTSVSMTINGPAPTILAMFMNVAVDQAVEKFLRQDSTTWDKTEKTLALMYRDSERPRYHGALPEGNDGLGLGLLGVTGEEVVDRATYERIKADTLRTVRGTVQADILKEDQAQNTCIFSTEFALRLMGDIQQFFIDHQIRNFYSVSISGYHIAEAGANPVTQLALTLANGFTIVEYYLARGMAIDDFAPNLSFFFSNGMDPEYSVIGRVARRIWARAMRERYQASSRSQMLKYHIQTSGRSLHAQEIQFNDIRTTLQAVQALFDNCNSLHTNAYDEAVTTPTEESVRRAVAIQLIINRELGLSICENPWQGSFNIDTLTSVVEEAVYKEFEAISARGGVLGAMDTMYQRGKIQEESLYYEQKKDDGSLPLIGVNTFLQDDETGGQPTAVDLIRSTDNEKSQQIANVEAFQRRRNSIPLEPVNGVAPRGSLAALQSVAKRRENTFACLIDTVRFYSLGQISHALYDVGGEYRRSM